MHRFSYWFKTVFTPDDKQLINSLRQLKGYNSRRFLKEFLQKNLTCRGLDLLSNMGLRKVPSSGQPHTVCMSTNTISLWIRLMLNK